MPTDATRFADQAGSELLIPADAVEHITEARARAREVLGCESHLGDVDDWRQAWVTARDAIVLLWLVWVALDGFGVEQAVGPILLCAGVGMALYLGIASGVATHVRVRYLESELERERREIEEDPEHEREEVRALYAAKGFREPLLSQVTDVLCADDDRLLKVMMEEELGLFIQHMNHPLLVAVWNAAGAAAGTLFLAGPTFWVRSDIMVWWMPGVTAGLVTVIGIVTARLTRRAAVPIIGVWLAATAFTGAVTHFLSHLIADWGGVRGL